MNILYILNSTDPFAGSTKSFLALIKGVISAGVNAIVVVPDTNGIYSTLQDMSVETIVQKEKGCTWTGARNLKQILLYIPRQLGRMAINYHAQRCLARKLRSTPIDIVHSNVSVASLGRYIARKRNLPHIYHIREYGAKDFNIKYFPTKASFHRYLKSEKVYTICITKDIQKYHDLLGVSSSRVIYNGIMDLTSTIEQTSWNRNYFLYAGRVEPTKGLLNLLHAYKAYTEKTIEKETILPLMVAGEVVFESYMQTIQDYIAKSHLGKYIQFLGKVTNMTELYQHAKAIIISSEFEAFGRCMPEAMLNGCITIAHNTGGSKEQYDNGLALIGSEIGFRYDTQEQLIASLINVHNMNEKELDIISKNAFQCVSQLYTNEKYIHSVLEFYHDIQKIN